MKKQSAPVEVGKFVEVFRQVTEKNVKRVRSWWHLGHIVGVGPCEVWQDGRHYVVEAGKLLVKLHEGPAKQDTFHTVDRLHDQWRLLFP